MSDANICPVCGGILENKTIQIDFRYGGQLVIVDGVPAQVCKGCGEQLVTAATSKQIDALLDSKIKPIRSIAVPVFPFRQNAQQ